MALNLFESTEQHLVTLFNDYTQLESKLKQALGVTDQLEKLRTNQISLPLREVWSGTVAIHNQILTAKSHLINSRNLAKEKNLSRADSEIRACKPILDTIAFEIPNMVKKLEMHKKNLLVQKASISSEIRDIEKAENDLKKEEKVILNEEKSLKKRDNELRQGKK